MADPSSILQDAAEGNQRAHALNTQYVAQAGQRAMDGSSFIAEQARLGFLNTVKLYDAMALQVASGLSPALNGAVLGSREVRDQPNVSPTIAFVPGPATAKNPT